MKLAELYGRVAGAIVEAVPRSANHFSLEFRQGLIRIDPHIFLTEEEWGAIRVAVAPFVGQTIDLGRGTCPHCGGNL